MPVTTYRTVCEERVEQVPVRVCRWAPVQETIRVPRCVQKRIPVTYTRYVPRTVCCRVPLYPSLVPVDSCWPPAEASPSDITDWTGSGTARSVKKAPTPAPKLDGADATETPSVAPEKSAPEKSAGEDTAGEDSAAEDSAAEESAAGPGDSEA